MFDLSEDKSVKSESFWWSESKGLRFGLNRDSQGLRIEELIIFAKDSES